jgi:hypothetical protein
MGLREDDGPITRNTSRFVPHVFRTSKSAQPPVMCPDLPAGNGKVRGTDRDHPLWDAVIDP